MIDSEPKFIQVTAAFTGAGYMTPLPLAGASYSVPGDKRAQPLYFRGGNSSAEMIAVMMLRDGKPMRTFPIGAKGAVHVQLAVVEDLSPDTKVDLMVVAPEGTSGTVVIDLGMVEIE